MLRSACASAYPPRPAPHVLSIIVALVERSDRFGHPERISRRDDDAALDRAHELGGFADCIGCGDHWTARGEDAIEAARNDVTQPARPRASPTKWTSAVA